MPGKTPLNAQVFGRKEHSGYTIEKVYFESYPGFLVTGNLYRPKGGTGPFPAVLCPHGHWDYGRLEHNVQVSEPARAINFAKQGYVVFAYDMVGYNDSRQLPHSFGGDREELWGINLLGLQLWDSIRAVDFISTLPDVDQNRISCTGASGGATQTFLLAALDNRVRVAAPVNMISADYQGGDRCENAPGLRVGTSNLEFGALMAPRPMVMVSNTGDWTKTTLEVEYPAIRSIYRLLDAEDKVYAVRFNAYHNYNAESRGAVFAWFGRWVLGITDESKLREQGSDVEMPPDQLVFYGIEYPSHVLTRDQIVDSLVRLAMQQIEGMKPRTAQDLAAYRAVFGPAMKQCLLAELPARDQVIEAKAQSVEGKGFTTENVLLGRRQVGDRIPCLQWIPPNHGPHRQIDANLLIASDGKAAMTENGGASKPSPLVTALLRRGQLVLAIDCF
jgi:hypothetical protein